MKSEFPMIQPLQRALRNGGDKAQVWIAYKGIMYAPHTEEVFAGFMGIGHLPGFFL